MKHVYKSKEAKAGHQYNISKDHREHESKGMKDTCAKALGLEKEAGIHMHGHARKK